MPLLILWGSKMIDIKKCKYKIVVDTREKVCGHIIKGFEKGFELKPSEHEMYRGVKSKFTGPVGYYKQDKGLKTEIEKIREQIQNIE